MSDGTFWALAIAATIVLALALTALSFSRAAARPWPGDALFGNGWDSYFAGGPVAVDEATQAALVIRAAEAITKESA